MDFQNKSRRVRALGDDQDPPTYVEQLHLFAFDLAPVGMCCLGLDARFIWVNEYLCQLIGYSAAELLGMHIADITHPEDYAANIAQRESFMLGITPVYENENRYLRKDCSIRWVAVTARLVNDRAGRPLHTLAVIRDVTRRKTAVAALYESEVFNRSIVEASSDCIKVLDANGRLEYMNSAGCGLMEIDDVSSLAGKTWASLWPAENAPAIAAALASALAGEPSHFEAFCPTWKGMPKWWEVTVTPALDAQRECQRIVVSSRDVTGRKTAEEALTETAERFRASVGIVGSFIWTNSADGKMQGEQAGWANFTGQTIDEYRDFGWANAVHPDDAQPTIDAWNEAVAEKKFFEFEHRIRRRDGAWRVCSIRAAPRLAQDETIREWLGVHTDITEKKQVEKRLSDSESMFRATFEKAPIGIAHVSIDGAWLRVNQKLHDILGYRNGELVGKTFLDITHPDDIAADLAHRQGLLNGVVESYEMEKRYIRKNSTVVWCNLTVGCVRQSDGSVDYFVSAVEDISERKRAEEQIKLLMGEVNHRSKNLLTVVLAIAQQTAQTGDPVTFTARLSQRIQGLSASQDLLVQNDWHSVGLLELVHSQLAHFKDLIGHRIFIEGPSARFTAMAAQYIGMALHELSTNASKYGALSNDEGKVNVSWAISTGAEPVFTLHWHEADGPEVKAPVQTGFGRIVLVRMVETAVGGTVNLAYQRSGLSWSLTCPADKILEGARDHR